MVLTGRGHCLGQRNFCGRSTKHVRAVAYYLALRFWGDLTKAAVTIVCLNGFH